MSDCVCDEMLKKSITLKRDGSMMHEDVCLSWDCAKHGKVTVDNRRVHIQQAPDPIKSYEVSRMISSRVERESEERKKRHPGMWR
jgi:hypothetical protein